MKLKIIGFDEHDTLLMNEPHYMETEQKFCELLSHHYSEKQINGINLRVKP